MEKRIEGTIDRLIDEISPEMIFLNIGIGFVLIVIGLLFIVSNIDTKKTKIGMVILCIGIMAFISGLVRYII